MSYGKLSFLTVIFITSFFVFKKDCFLGVFKKKDAYDGVEFAVRNDLFHIIPAKKLRQTPDVLFMAAPVLKKIDAIDYVLHDKNAISPAIKDSEGIFWYMHPDQEDNLLVIDGVRHVQLYSIKHGKIENFEVTSTYIKQNGKIIYEGMAILGWPTNIFHRIQSGPDGSKSINFGVHHPEYSIKTNFNIYTLDEKKGEYKVARDGFKDQNFSGNIKIEEK